MPIGGILFDKVGARPLVLGGGVLMAIATVILTNVSLSTQGPDLILPLAMYGLGMGLMLMPLNTHLINAAPRKLVSRVTSLTNALQQVISSLTIATLATVLTSRIAADVANARATVLRQYPNPAHLSPSAAAAMKQQLQLAITKASAGGFDDTFKVMVVLAVIGAGMGVVLRRNHAAQAAQPAAAMHAA